MGKVKTKSQWLKFWKWLSVGNSTRKISEMSCNFHVLWCPFHLKEKLIYTTFQSLTIASIIWTLVWANFVLNVWHKNSCRLVLTEERVSLSFDRSETTDVNKWSDSPQDGPICWLNTFSTLNYFLNALSNSYHRTFCSINNNFHPVNLYDSMNWSKGATLLRSKITKLHVFLHCVCVYLQSTQTCMCMQVNLHVQTWKKATGWHQNAFNHSSTLFLRQSLSLNKDFNVKTQLAGKRGDRIHLSPFNQL